MGSMKKSIIASRIGARAINMRISKELTNGILVFPFDNDFKFDSITFES